MSRPLGIRKASSSAEGRFRGFLPNAIGFEDSSSLAMVRRTLISWIHIGVGEFAVGAPSELSERNLEPGRYWYNSRLGPGSRECICFKSAGCNSDTCIVLHFCQSDDIIVSRWEVPNPTPLQFIQRSLTASRRADFRIRSILRLCFS